MDNKIFNFKEIRMEIFNKLASAHWKGKLNNDYINELISEIKEKHKLDDSYDNFIRDFIRVNMGFTPNNNSEFADDITYINSIKDIKAPIVNKIAGLCDKCDQRNDCNICKHEAHIYQKSSGPTISHNKCLQCGKCIDDCSFGAILDKIEFIPLVNILKGKSHRVFAAVAPSIVGQFGDDVSLGKLRTAFKLMGFEDMIEVALFADILTIKEALEFNHLVKSVDDFYLTSCCCPIWTNLTEKHYPKLYEHMSLSISPMVASGRILKYLYGEENTKVVFIGPCVAKKGEAKDPRVKGSIDFVLTYREMKEIFDALDFNLSEFQPEEKDQASFGGRAYARVGGVSFSVKTAVNRIAPNRLIQFKPKKVTGAKQCKELLDELSKNPIVDYNFIEGMGCIGGCVGGPRTNIDKDKATDFVNESSEDSLIMTPFDNMNAMKIFDSIGVTDIGGILEDKVVTNILNKKQFEPDKL
ncbi:[Fe-Fe] hydrogenase large subunit C-terminal domain-containing protein [Clostridiaceae bacterium M8S5]|nr:[Fe-Fe] hydrogenase large subunit C-terminal domain-containing protein [Clostridiaceae bacterium M8S5]